MGVLDTLQNGGPTASAYGQPATHHSESFMAASWRASLAATAASAAESGVAGPLLGDTHSTLRAIDDAMMDR